ncbi:UBR-type domain-containing protein [Mycena sanguinolenta]|uniref:UBR-type domain-containing protein n=1 Tax=Mycena sanguinolenta TaxID=230812 RepID=A0A8H6ZHS6_9AGAR|nr:UBR-type domain-containing protein [Mycena sanguinolenta]
MSQTLSAYVASQDELIQEAAMALPHQFSQCTYALGPVRQAVYLCLTCPEARGVCSACSIACHTDHNQVELFPKRNFRCDCPTAAIAHACTLHTQNEPANASNHYGQNFQAKFCRCDRPYDAKTERETMIQCLSCEDWFHESCCMLRTRPEPRVPTPEPDHHDEPPSTEATSEEEAAGGGDDAASNASSSGLPPPLITPEDYDAFVCRACVLTIPTLRRLVGTPGAITVVRADPNAPWTRLGDEPLPDAPVVVADSEEASVSAGEKRPATAQDTPAAEPAAKRARTESSGSTSTKPCLAPPIEPLAQVAYTSTELDWDVALCTGDVFLTENFRERWCRCDSCLPSLEAHPYLLEEEETYEPPEDPDSGLTLEELGMRALERLPRDRAIDGILAFNTMRDNLRAYLRPFAEDGKVVNEADVQTFFEQLNKSRAEAAS